MAHAIAQKGIPRDEASKQMIKYEDNAFTSLRELPDPLERPDELRLTPQSKPTPMHIHFLGTEALLSTLYAYFFLLAKCLLLKVVFSPF